MADEYRKSMLDNVWHFCSNCSTWPTNRYVSILSLKERPRDAKICNECKAKKRLGECE